MPDIVDRVAATSTSAKSGDIVDRVAAKQQEKSKAPAQGGTWLDSARSYASGLWSELNPVAMVTGTRDLINSTLSDPVGTGKGLLQAQDAVRLKAEHAFQRGDWGTGVRHTIGYLLPLIGPHLDAMGDRAQSGDVAGALGQATGFGLTNAGPAAMARAKNLRLPALAKKNSNAEELAALEYLERKGAEVGAANKTGSHYVRTVQKAADQTFLGSRVAEASQDRTVSALRAEADSLAQRAYGNPVGPEQVGRGMRESIAKRLGEAEQGLQAEYGGISNDVHGKPVTRYDAGEAAIEALDRRGGKLHEQADAEYGTVWATTSRPENVQRVMVGYERPSLELDQVAMGQTNKPFHKLSLEDQQAVIRIAEQVGVDVQPRPVYAEIATPVDMQPIQAAAEPLYRKMQTWMDPAKRNASEGFQALKSIVEGPKYRSAQDAEAGLGGLKDLSRKAPREWARDVSQGTAAALVKQLQGAIDEAVGSAAGGGDALGRLRRGRRLTATKHGVLEIVEKLREEPAEAFTQMTHARDASYKLLLRVKKEAPGQLGEIARALLDEFSDEVSRAGGVTPAIEKKWQNIGGRTKAMLYGDKTGRLDHYFARARAIAGDPARKHLNTEPVNLYRELVDPKDASIEFTEKMAVEAPDAMKQAGRSFLEDVFKRATAEGGFNLERAAGMWQEWQSLGDKTKSKLFPNPLHRADLDKFFLGIKAMGKNPNPSGTALVGVAIGEAGMWLKNPATGAVVTFGSAALSKLLHSPKGVKLLTEGMRTPITNRTRAGVIVPALTRLAAQATSKEKDQQDEHRP